MFLQKLHQRGSVAVDAPCCHPASHQSLQVIYLNRSASAANTTATAGLASQHFDVNHISLEDALVTSCSCA